MPARSRFQRSVRWRRRPPLSTGVAVFHVERPWGSVRGSAPAVRPTVETLPLGNQGDTVPRGTCGEEARPVQCVREPTVVPRGTRTSGGTGPGEGDEGGVPRGTVPSGGIPRRRAGGYAIPDRVSGGVAPHAEGTMCSAGQSPLVPRDDRGGRGASPTSRHGAPRKRTPARRRPSLGRQGQAGDARQRDQGLVLRSGSGNPAIGSGFTSMAANGEQRSLLLGRGNASAEAALIPCTVPRGTSGRSMRSGQT